MMETGSIISGRCLDRDRIRLTDRLQIQRGCNYCIPVVFIDHVILKSKSIIHEKCVLKPVSLCRKSVGRFIRLPHTAPAQDLFQPENSVLHRHVYLDLLKCNYCRFHPVCHGPCLPGQNNSFSIGVIAHVRINIHRCTHLFNCSC